MSFRPVGSSSSASASGSAGTASKVAAQPTSQPATSSTVTNGAATPSTASSYTGAGPAFPGAVNQSAAVAETSAGYDYAAAYPGYDYSAAGYAGYGTGYDASATYGGAYASTSAGPSYPSMAGASFDISDTDLQQQQSAYVEGAAHEQVKKQALKGSARRTVLRKGAGEVWEDQSLMEWDPAHFRLFIGDLGNDVNEDDLVKAFGPEKGWQSFVKAKVVRDKVTNKTRGYGFVSYSDPEDFMKGPYMLRYALGLFKLIHRPTAWKAMNGKYVGSRPVKIQKATTTVRQIDIGAKKARELDTKKKAHTVGNKVGSVVS